MKKEEVLEKIEIELKIQVRSEKTILMYKFFNEKFLDFIKKDPEKIDPDDVKKFLAYLLSEKRYNASSLALARSSLSFFYDETLGKKIVSGIKSPKKTRELPDVLTKDEVKKAINSCKNLRDKLLIEVLYASGLRVSECASLKWDDIDLEDKTGLLRKGKGGKDRFFILSDNLVSDLKKYKKKNSGEYIFDGSSGNSISVRNIQRIIKSVGKRAGLKKKVYPHLLRHTFATHLLESGVDIRKIQELLAHSSLNTTQFYAQVSRKELKKIKSPLDLL